MSGYFAKLIDHTGLSFSTPSDYRSSLSKTQDEVAPLHTEERRFVEPQQDQIDKSAGRVSKKSPDRIDAKNRSGMDTESKESEQPTLDPATNRVAKNLTGEEQELEKTKPIGEVTPPAQDEKEPVNNTEGPPQVETLVLEDIREVSHERCSEQDTGKESSSGDIQTPSDNEKSYARSDVESQVVKTVGKIRTNKKNATAKSLTQSRSREQRHNIWGATLQEVREWVAETPGQKDTMRIEGESRAQRQRGIIPDPFDNKKDPFSDPSSVGGSPQEKESEVQDFHLSIGTISLIIEEPQEKMQSNKPEQKIRRDEVSTKENNSSRLNRHYIRI